MIFTFQIDEHAGQFGHDKDAEQGVIRQLLALAASAIGSLDVPTESSPAPLVLNRMVDGSGVSIQVGRFWFGPESHNATEAAARAAVQAAADAEKAAAANAKAGKAA